MHANWLAKEVPNRMTTSDSELWGKGRREEGGRWHKRGELCWVPRSGLPEPTVGGVFGESGRGKNPTRARG